jgi:TetR/AcrR family transcriptional repressor of nem operon
MGKTSTDHILDAAETRVRVSGYNGFSFRDIAADVGVKSASIHHHFPTKATLGAALARRYTDRFQASLDGTPAGWARVEAYREAFRTALRDECRMCLCGVLGAESGGLPPEVTAEARRFFELAVQHLADGLTGHVGNPRETALGILARLEGAMILARTLGGIAAFDDATANLLVDRDEARTRMASGAAV